MWTYLKFKYFCINCKNICEIINVNYYGKSQNVKLTF